MANTIKLGYSNTSGQSPDTLEGGEVGINTSNRKVWVGNGTGNTLVFNHADYAPASANASESYVTSRGYITDGNTGWNNSYGFVTSSGVTSVATSGAINGGTITGTGTISHSTAAGNKHIPTGGSAGQFLKYSASGTAVWAADNNSTYTLASLGFTGATNANYFTYSHPTGNGNNHVPANGSSGQFLKYSSAGTAVWAADNNSTYTLASLGYTGATNANYFTCTLASLGGVTSAYVLNQLDNLVDAAPGALNTLNELAAAIGDDASYATTVTNALAGKAAASGNATQSWVSSNFNNYSHPTGNGNKHIPSGGSSGQFLKYSSAGTAVWAADNNTTYTLASLGYTGATNATYTPSYSMSAGGSTIVQRHSSGYIYSNYINTTDGVDTSPGWLVGKHSNGDNFHRSYTAATVRSFLGVAASANNYSHPTGNGNNHIPANGSSGQFLKYSSAGVATWAADNNTTYTLASLGYHRGY